MSDAKREYPDFTHFAAYTKRLRSCTLRLSDFRVVPRFGSHSSKRCYPLRPPGEIATGCSRHAFASYAWLGRPNGPAIRFTEGRLFGASWFAFAAAVKLLTPGQICPSNKIQNERRFRSPRGHRHLDCAREILCGTQNYELLSH